MAERTHCQQVAKDARHTICGHPLPCPDHTAVVEITDDRIKVEVPRFGDPSQVLTTTQRLMDIGRAIAVHQQQEKASE